MKNFYSGLILSLVFWSCFDSSDSIKKENFVPTLNESNIDSAIAKNSNNMLFLNFWYGMSANEFDTIAKYESKNSNLRSVPTDWGRDWYFDFSYVSNNNDIALIPSILHAHYDENGLTDIELSVCDYSNILTENSWDSNRIDTFLKEVQGIVIADIYKKKYKKSLYKDYSYSYEPNRFSIESIRRQKKDLPVKVVYRTDYPNVIAIIELSYYQGKVLEPKDMKIATLIRGEMKKVEKILTTSCKITYINDTEVKKRQLKDDNYNKHQKFLQDSTKKASLKKQEKSI